MKRKKIFEFRCTLTAQTMPSFSRLRLMTIASFQWLLLLLSPRMMTTSPMLGWGICFPPVQWWLFRRLLTCSAVHLFHITSVHFSRNLALFSNRLVHGVLVVLEDKSGWCSLWSWVSALEAGCHWVLLRHQILHLMESSGESHCQWFCRRTLWMGQ